MKIKFAFSMFGANHWSDNDFNNGFNGLKIGVIYGFVIGALFQLYLLNPQKISTIVPALGLLVYTILLALLARKGDKIKNAGYTKWLKRVTMDGVHSRDVL